MITIFDIVSLFLIVVLAVYIHIIDNSDSEKIDKSRDDIHDLQDYKWSIDGRIHDTRRDLKSLASSVEKLANELDELEDALHMQGIATEVKTEEVKVLVKPEDTDGEDSDN